MRARRPESPPFAPMPPCRHGGPDGADAARRRGVRQLATTPQRADRLVAGQVPPALCRADQFAVLPVSGGSLPGSACWAGSLVPAIPMDARVGTGPVAPGAFGDPLPWVEQIFDLVAAGRERYHRYTSTLTADAVARMPGSTVEAWGRGIVVRWAAGPAGGCSLPRSGPQVAAQGT